MNGKGSEQSIYESAKGGFSLKSNYCAWRLEYIGGDNCNYNWGIWNVRIFQLYDLVKGGCRIAKTRQSS